MELLKKYLVSGRNGDDQEGSDIVETLVDRFQSATRIEDKRDALRTLKSLSKRYRLEVGTKAMQALIDALQFEREDADCVCYSLETLYFVMNDSEQEPVDSRVLLNIPEDLGSQFTEIFIKKHENVGLVLECIDAYETHIRRNALRLITLLLVNQLKRTQEVILRCPRAIFRLVDVLSDPREALRNDVLLLLLELTKSHSNIQKIVAFENTFERLFFILQSEGFTDGGVVAEDCLRLLLRLLDGNTPNQILFKENNYVQRLLPLLQITSGEGDSQLQWPVQKMVNFELTLQIIRVLVSPQNKLQDTRSCQTVMHKCGLLSALCALVLAHGVPVDVLTKAIFAVADVIRGSQANQDFLAQLIAPSEPPQPAIHILLVSMVNERQTLDVRVAALYCFECYVVSNTKAQSAIVTSLLQPLPPEPESVSIGQLLCGGLFSDDLLSKWLSSITLAHCINDNAQLKEELLRVRFALKPGATSASLLQQSFNSFQTSTQFQTKVGLLQFLCSWLAYCPAAVRQFLTTSSSTESQGGRGANMSILLADAASSDNDEASILIRGLVTALICVCVLFNPGDVTGFDRKSLLNILERRMGLDMILEILSQVSKSQLFISASQHPELTFRSPSDLVFDYSFTQLFKRLEYEMIYTIKPPHPISSLEPDSRLPHGTSADQLIAELKQTLSEKDTELKTLRSRVGELEQELTATRTSALVQPPQPVPDMSQTGQQQSSELARALQRIQLLEQQLSRALHERDEIKAEQDDLLVMFHDQDVKVQQLKNLVRQLGGRVDDDSGDEQTTTVSKDPPQPAPLPQAYPPVNGDLGRASGPASTGQAQFPHSSVHAFTTTSTFSSAPTTFSSQLPPNHAAQFSV